MGTDSDLIKRLLLDIHGQMPQIESRLGSIEADLATHIKRTELLEVEVKYLHKQVNIAHGAIALVTFAAAVWKHFA